MIRIGEHSLRFESKKYRKKPKDGGNLFVSITKAEGADQLLIRLNDEVMDLDQPVRVTGLDGSTVFQGKVQRSKETARGTFANHRDRVLDFSQKSKST